MATTSIWKVEGWLGKVLIYVENPNKTDNPRFVEVQETGKQSLDDVIEYAMRVEATTSKKLHERFVSSINCSTLTARAEMLAVKKRYGKEDGIIAFHGYQSFAPNEVTPEIAHEIGVKLAEELWGSRFQVIVATHLDKENHLHNHFVINSVSYIDGYRYNDCKETYKIMRETSDRLCKEYGLSIIENPVNGRAKHYGEWKAEKEGRPTWRGLIKNDIDEAIASSITDKQFFYRLKEKGYSIKQGKDITLRPQGKQRGIKIARHFGEEYTYESIRRRILENPLPNKKTYTIQLKPKTLRLHGTLSKNRKIKGLRARYLYYCYKLGILPKKNQISTAKLHFLLREDIARLEEISTEAKLLCVNKIETSQQLFQYQEEKEEGLRQLTKERTRLHYQMRRKNIADEDKEKLKEKIRNLSNEIELLRKEVGLCKDIAKRSHVIKEKLEKIRQDEREEVKTNEHRWRSSRSSH